MGRPSHEKSSDGLVGGRLSLSAPARPESSIRATGAHSISVPAGSKDAAIRRKINKDDEMKDSKTISKNATPETYRESRNYREEIIASDDDSASEGDESHDEDNLPGAHFVGGINSNIVSTHSFVTVHSGKSTEFEQKQQHEPGLMTAIPVDNEEAGIVDNEKIQEEVREKILQEVVKAEEETEEDIKEQEKIKIRRRRIAALNVCFLILAGVVLGVLFGVVLKKDPEIVVTMSPTLAPTTIPPIFNPGDGADYNNACEDAFNLEDNVGAPIIGSTKNATKDDVDACEIIDKNGNGVWYRLAGDGRRMMASTCEKTLFDTQISIYKGACGKLQCVSGNDQISCGNGDQSQVAWFAEPETEYFIYIHGHRDSTGIFELEVDPMEDNGKCDDAQDLLVDVGPIFGSTRGTFDNDVKNCGSARQTAGGVWYKTTGTGDIISASLVTEGNTAFRGQISVFSGSGCDDLSCVDGSVIGFTSWVSKPGTEYYILVHGQGILYGDFLLELTTVLQPPLPPVEVADPCPAIEVSPFVSVGSSVSSSTLGEPIYNVESCGNLVFSTAQGAWFRVVGTGGALQVSTCGDDTDFDTQVSVFAGFCGSLECIDGNDQGGGDCGDSSSVAWFTLPGEEYYILVHGYGQRAGNFVLSVDEFTIETSDRCDTAIGIVPDGTSLLGATVGANATKDLPECPGSAGEETPGVWYIFEGTGNSITASTCQESSDVSSSITVFEGDDCGSLKCIEGVITPCGSQSSVAFPTSSGKNYYVFVQTLVSSNDFARTLQSFGDIRSRVPDGSFILTTEATPENDRCDQVVSPLSLDGGLIFASTRSATPRDGDSCSPEATLGRGVWYSVLGTGGQLTASTCSDFTNFVSNIEVFTGDCSALDCVDDTASSFCENQGSVITWDSIEGQLYFLYISGIGFEEYGNVALFIGSGNDLCYSAEPLLADGSVTVWSTIKATLDDYAPVCGSFITSPGVWFSTVGSGRNFTASTCHPETDFGTEVTIYQGSCTDLLCTNQISTALCGSSKSTVSWQTIEGEIYYILVHGYGVGNFGISLIEGNGSCEAAVDVLGAGPRFGSFGNVAEFSVEGTTVGMPEVDVLACGLNYSSPGAWYTIEGSGTNVTINACTELTFFGAQLSVLKGDCDGNFECIGTMDAFDTCQIDFTFNTVFGETYFVLVHGGVSRFDEISQIDGDFQFSVFRDEPVECTRSVEIPYIIEDGTAFFVDYVLDAGLESQQSDVRCGSASEFGTGGHWYSVIGTGENMTASTCFNGTDFDTQVTVYTGSCNALVCVDGNDDAPSDDFASGEGFDDEFPGEFTEVPSFTSNPIEGGGSEFTEFPSFTSAPFFGNDAGVQLSSVGLLDDSFQRSIPLRECGLTSTVSWPSEPGVVYFVYVHGYSGASGSYVLSIYGE